MGQKILYVDMDNVIVDFKSAFPFFSEEIALRDGKNLDEISGIFSRMQPLQGAVEALGELAQMFEVYILSTAPWKNPTAWSDKLEWVHEHLSGVHNYALHKRLILSHHKNLNIGDFLVDDRPNNGAIDFTGEWVHFGDGVDLDNVPCPHHSEHPYTDWAKTLEYLRTRA